MDSDMVMEFFFTQMAPNMKGYGTIITNMDSEYLLFMTVLNI
jgi:hypothetical protein